MKALIKKIGHLLLKNAHKKPQVIIKSDGGICSQIAFHALGLSFEKKGYIVKYDLSWFEECGKDLNGKFDRSFVLDKAFPELKILKADDAEIALFKKKYKKKYRQSYDINNPPPFLYIDGYPERMSHFIQNKDILMRFFNPIGQKNIQKTLHQIQTTEACAVHVRRGDLAAYTANYGEPASVAYFVRAMKVIQKYFSQKVTFFFFSDEMDWVQEHLIPALPEGTDYLCCSQNDSATGYLDLYLMTFARAIIASQGSMGIFAKVLSRQPSPPLALSRHEPEVEKSFENCIFIDAGRNNDD